MSEATQQTDVSEESEGGILGAGLDDAVGFEGENQGADQAAFVAETQADAQEFDPVEFDWLSGDIDQVPEQYKPLQKVARQQQSILNRTNMDMRNQEKRMRETEEKYLRIIENAPQQENEPQSTENGSILHTLGITPDSDGYDAAVAVESIAQAIVKPYLERLTGVETGVGQIMDSYQNTQARQQAAQQTAIQAEIDEATSTHGDAIWKHQDDIAYFRGKQNPETGQPYTVLQAFERVTQLNGAPAKSSAKPNRTGPGPRSVPSNNIPSGPMDSSQVLDGLKNLGFE
jgi:hypothetical protein